MAAEASDKETRSGELFDCKLKTKVWFANGPKMLYRSNGLQRGGGDIYGSYCPHELARHRLIGEAAWAARICCLDMCKIHLCWGFLSTGSSRSWRFGKESVALILNMWKLWTELRVCQVARPCKRLFGMGFFHVFCHCSASWRALDHLWWDQSLRGNELIQFYELCLVFCVCK